MQAEPTQGKPRRTWWTKFAVAFRGLWLGVKGDTSFFVHFFMAALVLAAAAALGCEVWQWCVLLGCIAAVLAAEMFNCAIETLFRGLDEHTKQQAWPALDVASGAVLLVSLFAALIGAIVFLTRLLT